MKILKTELCNVEQHVELFEVIVLSLSEEISPGNVFSEEIFLWIYVFLSPFHDLKQNFLKLLMFLVLLKSSSIKSILISKTSKYFNNFLKVIVKYA